MNDWDKNCLSSCYDYEIPKVKETAVNATSFHSVLWSFVRLCDRNFMKWTGPTEFVGKGGAVQTKEGIDFYMSGWPAGTFKVLSVIQGSYYRGGNLLMSALSEQAAMNGAIKEAKAEGADAIIVYL